MVKLKYSALYTDNLGCEQASVSFLKGELQLKVRGCTFKSDNFNFDFYINNYKKIHHLFYLKGDELIEYVIDIKILLTLGCDNNECTKEFLLRVERHKSYYNNSLSIYLDGVLYKVSGYDLQELLINMKKELPEKYSMEYCFAHMLGLYHIEINNEKTFDSLNFFNVEDKREYKKLQKVKIMYIGDECYLS